MLIDRVKLRSEMFRKNIRCKDLAEKLNIDTSTLSLKLHGKRRFTEEESSILISIFGKSIFFAK